MARFNLATLLLLIIGLTVPSWYESDASATRFHRVQILPGMLVNVTIGTPAQKFQMLIDTASPKTWVLSRQMMVNINGITYDLDTDSSRAFDPTQSSTFKQYRHKWSGSYDSMTVRGRLGSDNWLMGDMSIENQEFALINELRWSRQKPLYFDGSIGLGQRIKGKPDSRRPADPLESMIKQNLLPDQVFSIYLNKSLQAEPFGQLIWGGFDSYLCSGQLNHVDTFERWAFKIDCMATETNSRDCNDQFDYKGAIDSTSNLIKAPSDHFFGLIRKFRVKIGSQWEGLYELVDCDVEDEPDLLFQIADSIYRIPAEDLVIKIRQPTDQVATCYLAIKLVQNEMPLIVLGTPFLRNYCTIYDYSKKKLGFSLARQSVIYDATVRKQKKSNHADNLDDASKMLEKLRQKLDIDAEDSDHEDDEDDQEDNGLDICGICRFNFMKEIAASTDCGHHYHRSCLLDYFYHTGLEASCPLCRKLLPKSVMKFKFGIETSQFGVGMNSLRCSTSIYN